MSLTRRAYYAAVVAAGLIIHLDVVGELLGPGATSLLRRNSEAYVLMVLIPMYWDFIVPSTRRATRLVWYTSLLVATVVLQTGATSSHLPTAVVTLGEAFAATAAISLYLDWSRRRLGSHVADGGLAPWSQRGVYYGGVAIFTALIYQGFFADVAGGGVTEWLQVNAETYGAMVVVPLYFDLIVPIGGGDARNAIPALPSAPGWKISRLVWYATLVLIPTLVQTHRVDWLLGDDLAFWVGRITEAFLASIVISLYFDVIRRQRTPVTPAH